ncbi:ABC transporter ATP-binding protein [Alkalicoccobacillus murimartini]|uniref:ABC-2 type transport system ATP-binding protein n=1 Tax=Alkalicoccobacillus murimartini TaxID=171685 RepID=A0ABT9YE42_9BACI|nr:ABC transporter ATP-binding protein [Alkalicoccobacillus murimartini]MDQ0206119.1 ABC-2 type transport system ATP-binding protein [Alkalicoccobacillus murimartini]
MIETINLTKSYGSFTALNELNIEVKKGSVYGLVGQNGAGKSTTFQILSTLMVPTSGTAIVDGVDVVKNPAEVRRRIGYMPDFFGVYDQFRTSEYLDFYGGSYGLTVTERKQVIPKLLELVNLSHKANDYVDVLSRGMKQRLCLARCLIHDPSVLILDEPASGLDPRARIEMREILKELKSMDKTIIISSHILPELAEMCDQIGVVDHGKLVANGSVMEIHDKLQQQKMIQVHAFDRHEDVFSFFKEDNDVTTIRMEADGSIEFGYKGSDYQQQKLLKRAVLADLPLLGFNQIETDLEDIFMDITKEVESK